jgi:diaminohydroxyphosphoribosylaminopyrimidine deaminase/5-amino-6-(5-phosphoribosylamino)uracil reductase
LKGAGIATTVGLLEDECRRMNEGFLVRVTRGRPFTTLKLAMSLDGRIAASSRDSHWISSEESRRLVHQWRREADAVMVGAGTVIADNPRLTCRVEGGRDPIRIIIDQRLRSPASARVFGQRSAAPTIVVTSSRNAAIVQRRYGTRVQAIAAPSDGRGISLPELMREFGRRGWSKILIEGGARLAAAALRAGIVDRVAFFMAPLILGCGLPAVEGLLAPTVRDAIKLKNLRAQRIGSDWLLQADVVQRKSSIRSSPP